jgi:hypothetical protein
MTGAVEDSAQSDEQDKAEAGQSVGLVETRLLAMGTMHGRKCSLSPTTQEA